MNQPMNVDYLTNDPAGRWLLRTINGAYTHAGFTYATGRDGVTIATGGDAAITVGIYASDEHLHDGDPITLKEWHDTNPDNIRAAIALMREWIARPNA